MVSMADPYSPKPYILDRETAPAFWLTTILWYPMATGAQTGNRFSFIEQSMPKGLGPPTHRHPFAHEGFYVLDGVCAFNANGETYRAGAGTFIHLPRGRARTARGAGDRRVRRKHHDHLVAELSGGEETLKAREG
jgi:quercetin dioxygenase-like cupin family protein